MSDQLNVIQTAPRCRSLLSKGLYVNAGLPDSDQAEAESTGNYWCGKTQTIFGPDDQICDNENCRNATRSCYEAS